MSGEVEALTKALRFLITTGTRDERAELAEMLPDLLSRRDEHLRETIATEIEALTFPPIAWAEHDRLIEIKVRAAAVARGGKP